MIGLALMNDNPIALEVAVLILPWRLLLIMESPSDQRLLFKCLIISVLVIEHFQNCKDYYLVNNYHYFDRL